MSPDTIRMALLANGYFPRELPTAFTTSDFGKHSSAIINEWQVNKVFAIKSAGKIKGKKKRNGYSFELKDTEPEVISKPKKGYERRNFHITHPVPQALLFKEISQNWPKIQLWLARAEFSGDRIEASPMHERGLREINFPSHRARTAFLVATSDWIVKTDISSFYPSIYTHSITWAAYGKENVKADLNKYKGTLADRMDQLVRNCNRNQTIGIPIGPESSRILAEVISARIDSSLSGHFKDLNKMSIDRLQDDWTIGTQSLEKADQVLARIRGAYREFGLEINGSKTSIEHVSDNVEKTWLSELRAFSTPSGVELSGSKLEEFLTVSIRLHTESKISAVMNYTLTLLESKRSWGDDVNAIESFLLKAAAIAPASLDKICRIILNVSHSTNAISKNRIAARFNELAARYMENGFQFEVIWLLWCIRGLRKSIQDKRILKNVDNLKSSAIGLILLDMNSLGLVRGKLPISDWEAMLTESRVLSDWTWLLGYEGIRHGWLKDTKNLMSKPFFKPMSSRGVVFYDATRNVPKSAETVKLRKQIRLQQMREVSRLIERARGLDDNIFDFDFESEDGYEGYF